VRTSGKLVYLDSSALVKLVLEEAESSHLGHYLTRDRLWVSCALARVEVVRAVRPSGLAAVTRAQAMLLNVHLVRIDDELLDEAAGLDPFVLRSLDAIHLAAARSLDGDLDRLVTYDLRMAEAARRMGIAVDSPGQIASDTPIG